MATDKQIQANRMNAQLSTGPATPESRRRVRLNAMTHNHTGQTVLVAEHEIEAYRDHFASFRKEYKPKGPTEEYLVHSLSDLTWSIQKVRCDIQNRNALIGTHSTECSPDESETPDITSALGNAHKAETNGPTINTLGIYEARKMRLFTSTRKELVAIQEKRLAAEAEELAIAVEIRKLDKATRKASEPEWQPAKNGFVCSLEEIDREIMAQEYRKGIIQLKPEVGQCQKAAM